MLMAYDGGYDNIVQMLLDKGADVNAEDAESPYGNALQAACARGHETLARKLLDEGAKVNARGGLYGSALAAARAGDYENVARLLMEKGARAADKPKQRVQPPEQPAVREVYELMRCPGPPCQLKPYCWYDFSTAKRYRLLTAHLKLLVQYRMKGNKVKSYADVPDHVRRKIYAVAQ